MTNEIIAEILAELNDGGRLLGSDAADGVAEEWSWCPDEATLRAWIGAGCWDGERTEQLYAAGVRVLSVAALRSRNGERLGYSHSNGDVSTVDVIDAVS